LRGVEGAAPYKGNGGFSPQSLPLTREVAKIFDF